MTSLRFEGLTGDERAVVTRADIVDGWELGICDNEVRTCTYAKPRNEQRHMLKAGITKRKRALQETGMRNVIDVYYIPVPKFHPIYLQICVC